jgi:hypothetical protein
MTTRLQRFANPSLVLGAPEGQAALGALDAPLIL